MQKKMVEEGKKRLNILLEMGLWDEVTKAFEKNGTTCLSEAKVLFGVCGINFTFDEMPDLVSQFLVSGEYSQISYKEGTYRVTPLAYDGFIKYVKNMSKGIPGYIIVNTTTGLTELKRLEKGMKYVPSAYFFDNLYRKLRISHRRQRNLSRV